MRLGVPQAQLNIREMDDHLLFTVMKADLAPQDIAAFPVN